MFNTISVRTFSEDYAYRLKIHTFMLQKMSLGNYSIHKARSVQEWLAKHPKVKLYFSSSVTSHGSIL